MNRRNFLRVALIGGGATIIVSQGSFFESFRTYFFAPKRGWNPSSLEAAVEAIKLEVFAIRIPDFIYQESSVYRTLKFGNYIVNSLDKRAGKRGSA